MAATKRIGACPRCGRSVPLVEDNLWRPFCGERCKTIDFGGWITEQNRIPGTHAPGETIEEDKD